MKFKIRFASQITGLFVLIGLGFVATVLVLMGINQRWFAKNYFFNSTFASASGLNVGMGIKYKGFEIGKVTNIGLNEENNVRVDFYIQDIYYPKVVENSILQLTGNPLGLGGGIVFHPGKEKTEPLPEFSYIPSYDFKDGMILVKKELVDIPEDADQISRILNEITPILKNVNKILIGLNTTVGTVNETLEGTHSGPLGEILNETTTIVADVGRTTGSISSNIDDTLVRTNTILASLAQISENLESTTEALKDPTGIVPKLIDPKGSIATLLDDNNVLFDDIEKIMENINASVANLKEFSDFVNSTQPQITGLIEEGRQAIDTGKDVLEGIRNNPLISGGITESDVQADTSQSYRDEDFE